MPLDLPVPGADAGTWGTKLNNALNGTGPGTLAGNYLPKTVRLTDLAEPWIAAHRGGENVHVENTLEAFRASAAMGVQALEMDVNTTADGAGVLFHDDTVDRVTTATGDIRQFTAGMVQGLTVDCATWFLPSWPNTKPVLWDTIAAEFGGKVLLLPEAKRDSKSCMAIVAAAQRYGFTDSLLINTFYMSSVGPAVDAGMPIWYLNNTGTVAPAEVAAQGATYYGFQWDAVADRTTLIASILAAGLKPISYVIDRRVDYDAAVAAGVVGIISDDPVHLDRSLDERRHLAGDPYAAKTYYHGQLANSASERGTFVGTDRLSLGTGGGKFLLLQGWANPWLGTKKAGTYSISFDVTFDTLPANMADSFLCYFAATSDRKYADDGGSGADNGYHFFMRANGEMSMYRWASGSPTPSGSRPVQTTAAMTTAGVASFRIDVSPTAVTVTRTDVATPNTVTLADGNTVRGEYLYFGRSGAGDMRCSVSNVVIA